MKNKGGYCLNCGKNISYLRWKNKYCSDKCRSEYYYKKNKEKYEDNYEKNKEKLRKKYIEKNKNRISKLPNKRECILCKTEFKPKTQNQKYCSKLCSKNIWENKYNKAKKGLIILNNGKSGNYYKLRFEIFKRDNFTCQYCGRNVIDDKIKLHLDHIIPKSKGGKNVSANLITSCEECNLGKGDVLLEEKHLTQTSE